MVHPLFLITYPFSAEIEVKQMGWLQFIESMTGHLAWPLVILILLIMVRKQIHSLAERILELSFGGATVKFEKLLSQGAEIIQEAPPQPPRPDEPELPLSAEQLRPGPEITRLWRAHVYSSVLPAYEMLSEELARLGEELGVKTRDGSTIIRLLWKRELIPYTMVDLFNTLREARDALAHARALPPSFAIEEYSRQAGYLLSELRIAGAKLKNGPKKE
ncbi:hypothetical protein JQ629_23565 [Bradyrhizobium sp. AUGA SZCCT0222]|uniref:hypothetical protein n=1 Tax=Bradyrhizobium sp. AUGA SZCCT0222 TaxID=2807668 RepID=UPI001BACA030|nr:hypothetical protein [Bradyrhizobium sp. AUGA SZCCT0222]MBR1270458.1 hypothetical protein [Bradyrhizobium sp. AUGA SZCCT0222]